MTNNPPDELDDVLERCAKDPTLNPFDELRTIAKSPAGVAFVEDARARDTEMRARFVEAIGKPGQIEAKPETAAAITSYHKNVVVPLLSVLLNELRLVQFELAMHKKALGSD